MRWFAAFAIALTAFFNIRGVSLAAMVSNVTVLAKYGGLVFIVLVAFGLGLPATGGHFTPVVPAGSFTLAAFGLALVSTLWAFDGWADLAYNAGEVVDPAKNLPRALIGGTLAVVAIYLLANLAYLAVLPIDQIRVSKLVAADVAQAVLGPVGVAFVSVTVMISTFGTLNTVLFTSPRIFFAMANDRLFFRPIASVHPRWGTPWVSISMTASLGIVFVLSRSFEQLADAFVTASLPFYALAVASVFRLRRVPGYAPSFRAPLFPLVPLLFLASVLYLLANAIVQPESRVSTLAVLGVVAAGIPIYYLTVGRPSTDLLPDGGARPRRRVARPPRSREKRQVAVPLPVLPPPPFLRGPAPRATLTPERGAPRRGRPHLEAPRRKGVEGEGVPRMGSRGVPSPRFAKRPLIPLLKAPPKGGEV